MTDLKFFSKFKILYKGKWNDFFSHFAKKILLFINQAITFSLMRKEFSK